MNLRPQKEKPYQPQAILYTSETAGNVMQHMCSPCEPFISVIHAKIGLSYNAIVITYT